MVKKKHGCGRCRMQVSKTPWQQRQTTRTRALFDEDEAEQDEQPPGTMGSFFYNLRQSFRDVGGPLAYKYFNWRKARVTVFKVVAIVLASDYSSVIHLHPVCLLQTLLSTKHIPAVFLCAHQTYCL